MAILLPAVAFALLVPLLGTLAPPASDDKDGWERPFLLAAPLWGGLLVAILELLGAGSAIRQGPLAVAWLLVDVALLAGLSLVVRQRGWQAIWRPSRSALTSAEWAFLAILGTLLVGLLAVALAAPPNNADSLLYHMARVVHWAQNGSLRHYGTAYGNQLWYPPWAELAILDARVLWGDDRLSNLIQWGAFVGALVGVSSLGRSLGLDRRGRILAVGFAASVPMAVLQATSTQNDLVTAFWLVIAAAIILRVRKRALAGTEIVSLGLAIGLGMLTKGTFYLFCLPLLVWYVLTRPWRARPSRMWLELMLVAGVALLPNLGYWARNFGASGGVFGPSGTLGTAGAFSLAALKPKIALFLPRVLRGLAQHLAMPWPEANAALDAGVKSVFAAYGVVVNAPMALWGWNNEDYAGSPFHLLLVGGSIVVMVARGRRFATPAYELAGCVAGAGLLMSLVLSWALTTEGVRYHLPLFLLWSPLFALAAGHYLRSRARLAFALVLVALGIPWMLFNQTRPVIGLQPEKGKLALPCSQGFGCTSVPSVFVSEGGDLLFARAPKLRADLPIVAAELQSSSCRNVGLRIDSSDPEYAIWYLLQAPQSGFRLETIYTTAEFEGLLDRSYRPCAIICTICGDRTRLHGLPLISESGSVKLFLGARFTWDENG